MKRILSAIILLLLCVPAFAQTSRPVPAVSHVVIISVDGMRPDLILRADAPHVRELMKQGSFTFWAKTTEMSITLPSHTSIVTGVTPDVHGIKFNDDGPVEAVYPKVPTIFELAKKAGYTTAMSAGKSKFAVLAKPGSVDWISVPERGKGGSNDTATADAVKMIQEHQPGVLFLHLPDTDAVGHAKGWGTDEQMKAFENADACIGKIMDAVKAQNLTASTVLILTADHGGRQKWHGPDDPRARHIPWIAVGPGIRHNFDLDIVREKQVNTEDTFATSCIMLGIDPGEVSGKMVKEILEKPAKAEPVFVP